MATDQKDKIATEKSTEPSAIQPALGNRPLTTTVAIPLENPSRPADPIPSGSNGQPVSDPSKNEPKGATQVTIEPWEIVASIVAMILWLTLLACGISISTKPFLDSIASAGSLFQFHVIGDLIVVIFCHTATNSAMCCVIAAFLGVIGSRATAVSTDGPQTQVSGDRFSAYAAAITRGFFVYLVLQSGAIALSSDPLNMTTLEEYVRLAALASLVSFAVGFNPMLFQNLLSRVDALADGGGKTGVPGGSKPVPLPPPPPAAAVDAPPPRATA